MYYVPRHILSKRLMVCGLTSLLLLGGCSKNDAASNNSSSSATPVTTQTVKSSNIELTTTLNGRIASVDSAEIRPQVSGVIQKIFFKEGSIVHQGDLLYQIDPSSYQATVNQDKASLKSAIATRDQNLATFRRGQVLYNKGVISKSDYDDQKYTYLSDDAAVQQQEAALQGAEVDLRHTKIRAPITGVIGRSSFTQGALVSSEQTDALSTIRKLDPAYIDVTANLEQYYAIHNTDLSEAQRQVTLYLGDDKPYPQKGRLMLAESYVDESTGTVVLRSIVPNPQNLLLPGMYIQVQMYAGSLNHGYRIPVEAVQRDTASHAYVYLVNDDNKVVRQNINTLQTDGRTFVVDKGLKDGDRIITDGINKIQEGSTVTTGNGGQAHD